MSFNYEIVKHITNKDFFMSARTLLSDCEAIEQKYNSGDLRSCCKDARAVNEVVLRYMYERLIGYRKKAPMAGAILRDIEFTSKIDDVNLIMAAEEVQRIGNQYVHDEPYPNESDEQFKARMKQAADRLPINAEAILEKLTIALEGEISFINQHISGVRGKLAIEFKKRLSSRTGKEECVLEADLTDVINRKDYTYIWKIQGQNTPYRERTYVITLDQPWMIGKTIILEASNNSTGQTLSKQYGPIKEEEVISKTKKPGGKINPVSSSIGSKDGNVALGGHLYIEKMGNYNGAGVKLQAVLTDADFKLEDDDVSIVWGFVGDDGNFIRITGETAQKSTSFRCYLKNRSIGKRYRCIVSRRGYEQTLEADYRQLTADDFAISGIIEIKADPDERVLKAVVKNPNYNGQPVYEWLRNGAVVDGFNDRAMPISVDDVNAVYVCKISLPDQLTGYRVSENYTVKSEDIQKTIITGSDQTPGVDGKHKDVSSQVAVSEPKKEAGNIGKQLKFENSSFPMVLPKTMPRLFNASNSCIHYFVCPNDKFVLNSLEIIRPDLYLYRLLRHEGYERIVFIEVENNKNLVIVYDEASGNAFENSQTASKNKISHETPRTSPRGMMGRPIAQVQHGNSNSPNAKEGSLSFRRQQLRMFSTAEEFVKLFTIEISNALEGNTARTAIVMPLTIFDQNGYCTDAIINTVRKLEREHLGKNILLLTMPRRGDLLHCYQNRQASLHPWTQDIQKVGSEDYTSDRVSQAIRALDGRIVLADRYEVDEIANLLFRKIAIEGNVNLGKIDPSKVYTVAEQLKEHSLKEKKHYRNIPNNNMGDHLITQLDKILSDDEYAEEIVISSEKQKFSKIAFTDNINPLMLERVYHMNVSRHEGEGTLEEIEEKFDQFYGEEMQSIIAEIRASADYFLAEKQRIERLRDAGMSIDDSEMPYMNMVFYGPPGTGKTSIARLTASYLKAKGILKKGSYVEIMASRTVEGTVGRTAANIRESAERAVGGVLFIDEFQRFNEGHSAGNIAEEAMGAIVSVINEHRSDLCVIIGGYKGGVEKAMGFDEGANRRFPTKINFKNYSVETLLNILHLLVKQRGESLEEGVDDLLIPIIESRITEDREDFGNAGYIKDELLPILGKSKSARDISSTVYTVEDVKVAFPKAKDSTASKEEILKEFDGFIGDEIKEVKKSIIGAAEFFLYMKEKLENKKKTGKKIRSGDYPFMNMIFLGSPGTGKTSVAELTADYFRVKGVMSTNRYVYKTASELVENTVGDTAKNIRKAAEDARGGVLFIDEFQGFNKPHSTGNVAQEAMQEIVSITNEHKGNLCLIIGGYKGDVDFVLEFDKGSGRRFPRTIVFKDYSTATLLKILDNALEENGEVLDSSARPLVEKIIEIDRHEQKERFGNGGYILDVLLGKLTEAKIERDRKDPVYRVEDVRLAFKDKLLEKENKPAFFRVSRKLFEGIDLPYKKPDEGFNKQNLNAVVEPAVLLLTLDDGKGYGTGFLIRKDGYALTCNHVIKDAKKIVARVRIPEKGMEFERLCRLEFAHPEIDMALIKLEDVDDLPYLPLASENRKIEKGEDFILVGYPFGKRTERDPSLYDGHIASFQKDQFMWDVSTIRGEAKSGNSGSPIVSLNDGLVIGILPGSWDNRSGEYKTEEINWMRPIKYFWKELVK